MPRERKGGSLIAGLIVGALAGVAAGLLLAPKAGKETQAIVKDKGGRYIGNLRDRLRRDRTDAELSEATDGREESSS